MRTGDERYETPKRRTALLLIGFALLVGIGLMTVLRPEVEDEPNDDTTIDVEMNTEQRTDERSQE